MPAQDNSEINTLMKEIVTLGEPGLNAIIASIKPAGEGDDSQARFALGSMAFYLTNSKPGNEQNVFAKTIAGALNKNSNDEVNDFYLGLLQIAGTNEVVPIVAEYLKNAKLCDPAVRALVDIGTDDAEKALIKALNTNNLNIQTSVVEGLGYIKSKESADKIRKLSLLIILNLKRCVYMPWQIYQM